MSQSISAKYRHLHQRARRRRKSVALARRGVAAPETLESRTLLAGDVFSAGDVPDRDETQPGDVAPPFPGRIYVSGTKWEDFNANGFRDRNEPGLGGVTIYSDVDRDGQLGADEPHTITQDDGQYFLELEPGEHFIAEVVPVGFEQTFPAEPRIEFADLNDEFATVTPSSILFDGPSPETVSITVHPTCIRPYELSLESSDDELFFLPLSEQPVINGCGGDTSDFEILLLNAPVGQSTLDIVDAFDGSVLGSVTVTTSGAGQGGHYVFGELGEETFVEGLDFGNHRDVPGATVHGRKWQDQNQNGVQDANEAGLGGVTIFADTDGDGRLDRNEPRTETSFDDPNTDFDESGFYSLEDLNPGAYVIREVVPEGFRQTFPLAAVEAYTVDQGQYADGNAIEMVLDGGSSNGDALTLEFSVLFNNGCGMIDAEKSVATVLGNTVAVELQGYQTGIVCTEALEWRNVRVDVQGVPEGGFQVFTTLHESFVDFETGEPTDDIATLVTMSEVYVSDLRGHAIEVGPEESVDGLDFGNYRLPPGEAHGTKWLDANGNGFRDDDEPGLAGVTIYSDANGNGVLDEGEAFTVTLADDPATAVDETGTYVLSDLAVGPHWIKEIVPDNYVQTFPWGFGFPDVPFPEPIPFDPDVDPDFEPFPQPLPPEFPWVDPRWCGPNEDCLVVEPPFFFGNGWHDIWVEPGLVVEGLDFGNQRVEPGSIHGTKWLDVDGDGVRAEEELGLAGVTIYVDANANRQFDEGELHAVTMSDDPNTALDETGMYWIDGVPTGQHSVREVVPDGYVQTFPLEYYWEPWHCPPGADCALPDWLIDPFYDGGAHHVFVGNGQTIESIDFGNAESKPGVVSGTKWLDANGNGWREDDEVGLAGVTIYVDANFNGQLDEDERSTVTLADDPNTAADETGRYSFDGLEPGQYEIREVVPDDFVQTFPYSWPRPFPVNDFPRIPADGIPVDGVPRDDMIIDILPPPSDGAHYVFIRTGSVLDGLDFGNRKYEPAQVHGVKWHDLDGDGQRSDGEPGLAGVTIYADIDFDGRFNPDFEPSTVTMSDDPNTQIDETGHYWLTGLEPGQYVIREVVPDGFVQTYPYEFFWHPHDPSFPIPPFGLPVEPDFPIGGPTGPWNPGEPWIPVEPIVPDDWFPGPFPMPEPDPFPFPEPFPIPYPDSGGGHYVYLEVGAVVEGLDFGNREAQPLSIEGRKWQDDNGNGLHENNEPGIGGVTIYIDANNNGLWDRGETATETLDDDPATDFDEAGMYAFRDVEPGRYFVRELVPDGFEQTFPQEFESKLIVEPGYGVPIDPIVIQDFHLLGDPEIQPTTSRSLDFLVYGGCGSLEFTETSVEIADHMILVTLTVDSGGHEVACDADPVEAIHSVELGYLESGDYLVQANLLEINTDGVLHESFFLDTFLIVEDSFQRVVYVSETQSAYGIDFGNRPIQGITSTIEGRKWQDDNGNGRWDRGEVGLGGVTVYLDANNNGVLDRGEVTTVTEFDIPLTDFDEAGLYSFGVSAGEYVVREIVPGGFEQTFPRNDVTVTLLGMDSEANEEAMLAGIHEVSLGQPIHNGTGTSEVTLIVTSSGCGGLKPDETFIEHNDAQIDLHLRAYVDVDPSCEVPPITEMQTIDLGYLEPGDYNFQASVIPNFNEQDAYVIGAALEVVAGGSASHRVSVADGEVVSGLDFGNQPIESLTGRIGGNVFVEGGLGEPGLLNAEVFIDLNLNGQFDDQDLVTPVISDFDGQIGDEFVPYYEFAEVEPGFHVVRMVPSDEYEVTFPNAEIICLAVFCTPDMHTVDVVPGGFSEASFRVRLNQPALAVWAGEIGNGDWDNPTNWTIDGKEDAMPSESSTMGDDVVFAAGGGLVELGSDEQRLAHSLHFNEGTYDLTGDNVTFDVTSGDLFVDDKATARIEAFLHSSGGSVTKNGEGLLLVFGGADRIRVESGTLGGGDGQIGDLRVDGGRLAPGASIGSMSATTLVMNSAATLEIEFGDDGSHDVVNSHVALLNGDLDIRLIDGSDFAERGTSQSVSVLKATGAMQGKFDSVGDRHLGNGVFVDVSYESTGVDLHVLTALPGDANGDGAVDAVDLGIWQSNRFGLGSWTDGDFSGDGVVDVSDFNLWKENSFERVLTLPSQGSVPQAALAAQAVAVSEANNRSVGAGSPTGLSVAGTESTNSDGLIRGRDVSSRLLRRGREGAVHNESHAGSKNPWMSSVDDLFAELGGDIS